MAEGAEEVLQSLDLIPRVTWVRGRDIWTLTHVEPTKGRNLDPSNLVAGLVVEIGHQCPSEPLCGEL